MKLERIITDVVLLAIEVMILWLLWPVAVGNLLPPMSIWQAIAIVIIYRGTFHRVTPKK